MNCSYLTFYLDSLIKKSLYNESIISDFLLLLPNLEIYLSEALLYLSYSIAYNLFKDYILLVFWLLFYFYLLIELFV